MVTLGRVEMVDRAFDNLVKKKGEEKERLAIKLQSKGGKNKKKEKRKISKRLALKSQRDPQGLGEWTFSS